VDCEIDLRPSGIFRTVMRSPEGQEFPSLGCYLEVIENERLVWTNVLAPGFRPATLPKDDSCDALAFTAVISLEPQGAGQSTRRSSFMAMKRHARGMRTWASMTAGARPLDQLVAVVKNKWMAI
jgi:uncharacterized protein YndB with AHSA1/START domain